VTAVDNAPMIEVYDNGIQQLQQRTMELAESLHYKRINNY
jgi:hypothetical protein